MTLSQGDQSAQGHLAALEGAQQSRGGSKEPIWALCQFWLIHYEFEHLWSYCDLWLLNMTSTVSPILDIWEFMSVKNIPCSAPFQTHISPEMFLWK